MRGETVVLYLCSIAAALMVAPTSFVLSGIMLAMGALLAIAS